MIVTKKCISRGISCENNFTMGHIRICSIELTDGEYAIPLGRKFRPNYDDRFLVSKNVEGVLIAVFS